MNNFIFQNATKVYFGKGVAKEYLKDRTASAQTILLAYGGGSIKRNGIYDEITGIFNDAGKTIVEFSGIMANPTYAKVQEGAKLARENNVDMILAVGGGSVMDCCKAVSLQAVYDGDIWNDFWAKPGVFEVQPLPLGVIVTVTGTGSECNGGAVITNEALMKGVIRDLRAAIKDPKDYTARSNLMWEATMGENRVIKMGKQCDFQCHNMEHQLGAFTDCNHGAGLAVLHPVYYRMIYKDGLSKFVRFAKNVWGISRGERTDEELALAGIDALADFIKEIGLPTSFKELGLALDAETLRTIADSCGLSAGSYKKLTHDDVYDIFCLCNK